MIKSRPFSITLVCITLLAAATFSLFVSFSYLAKPETQAMMDLIGLPVPVQVLMIYLNIIVLIVTTMCMLQEANWARWVYLGWGFIGIDYALFIHVDRQLCYSLIGIYLISAIILLLPSANRYFSATVYYDLDDDER